MPSISQRRLPGFRFEAITPELPEALPRMDIAVFVGFAAAGPLDQPVPIEDAAEFHDVFGDDLPLARDTDRNETVHAYLGPAVRAFFRNGGRRCWVIRVAERVSPKLLTAFPIPGLAIAGPQLQPAVGLARCQGAGFDSLEVGAAMTAIAVNPLTTTFAENRARFQLERGDEIVPGDFLRVTHGTDGWQAFVAIETVTPLELTPEAPRAAFEAVGRCAAWLLPLSQVDLPAETSPPESSPPAADSGLPSDDALDGRVRVRMPSVATAIAPGSLVPIPHAGPAVWMRIETVRPVATDATGNGSLATVEVEGRAYRHQNTQPPLTDLEGRPRIETLRFELRIHDRADATGRQWRLEDLGFSRDDRRWWGAAINDEALFTPEPVRSPEERSRARFHADLIRETRSPRFPMAAGMAAGDFIPIGMEAIPETYLPVVPAPGDPLEREGLKEFGSALFLDPAFDEVSATTLLAHADHLRYAIDPPRPLRGIHAALEIDEATLIAVPDAIHRRWERTDGGPADSGSDFGMGTPVPHPAWWRCVSPDSIPVGVPPPFGSFLPCSLRHLPPPRWTQAGRRVALAQPASVELRWAWAVPNPPANPVFVIEVAGTPDFADTREVHRGPGLHHTVHVASAGSAYYRVRAEFCGDSTDWSDALWIEVAPRRVFAVESPGRFSPNVLLRIQRALLRLCAARGDLTAVLALPGHFHEGAAIEQVARLRQTLGRPAEGALTGLTKADLPLAPNERHALTYGALYHPWLVVREDAPAAESAAGAPGSIGGQTRRVPPDGSAAGLIARRTLERGAWIAPANDPWRNVVALDPALGDERQLDLLMAQLNQVRREPAGFLCLNADTLADETDAELRPLNVRRLLILLRRAALKLGMNYVFEPNDSTLRRQIHDRFTGLLDLLFTRGAFAGDTAASSYQVVTDDSLNPPRSVEQGRLFVDLRVAPALPLTFLTVRLVQRGERAVAVEIR